MGEGDWLTIQQLADRWSVSYDTIRRELDAGKLGFIRVGCQYRIKRASVEAREHTDIKEGTRNVRNARRGLALAASKDHYPDC